MRAAMLMTLLAITIMFNLNASVAAQENAPYVYHLSPSAHPTIRRVTVWLDQPAENNPELIIYEKKPSSVPDPGLSVLSYFSVYTDSQIQKIEAEFAISYDWLNQNNAMENDVVLLQFENDWLENPAQLVDNDESYVYFRSDASNASAFAIAAYSTKPPGILLPVAVISITVFSLSVVYWALIRPRKSFISLKKLKKSGLPVIKDKEAIISLKKSSEREQPSAPEEDAPLSRKEKDLEALRKLQRRSGGEKNGEQT